MTNRRNKYTNDNIKHADVDVINDALLNICSPKKTTTVETDTESPTAEETPPPPPGPHVVPRRYQSE